MSLTPVGLVEIQVIFQPVPSVQYFNYIHGFSGRFSSTSKGFFER